MNLRRFFDAAARERGGRQKTSKDEIDPEGSSSWDDGVPFV